jgi:hypothetical protein
MGAPAVVRPSSSPRRVDKRLFFGDKLVDRISASMDASNWGHLRYHGRYRGRCDQPVSKKDQRGTDRSPGGPTAAELEQARMVFVAGFVRGRTHRRFRRQADALAEHRPYGDSAASHQPARIQTSTAQVRRGQLLAAAGDFGTVEPGEVTRSPRNPAPAGNTAAIPKGSEVTTTWATWIAARRADHHPVPRTEVWSCNAASPHPPSDPGRVA